MKSRILTLFAALALAAATAFAGDAGGPIHVLFLGGEAAGSRPHVHALMQELGRDAIWFEYADDVKTVTPERLALFDAVIEDGATMAGGDPNRVGKIEITGDEKTWLTPE